MAIRLRSTLRALVFGVLCGSAFVSAAPAAPASTQELDDVRLDASPAMQPLGLAPAVVDIAEASPRVLTLDLTRDANDVWDRIRRGFGMPDLDTELVAEQQLFYLNRPAFLKRVFERGGRYLWHIVDELERRGMPTELALLPMVESSYNPLAYSRAHASGLWQFIPSTGRSYNLTQDQWVDERRDVIASTAAALDYLQVIYDMHGDWHLALASYNWGEGAVGRALQRNLDDGLPAEYSHLRMPDETRNYVPKLQALKNIVAQPELFHIELPYVPNSRHFVSIDAPAGIDLATAARLADMSVEDFLALNPSHKRPILAESSSLIVPVDRAEQFQDGLAEHERDGKRWKAHELQRGETLASVARTYGLSLTELSRLNGLPPRKKVGVGYALLVPDGIDPDGALDMIRLIPGATGLSLSASGVSKSGKAAAGSGKRKKASAKSTSAKRSKSAKSAKRATKKAAPRATKGAKPAVRKAVTTKKPAANVTVKTAANKKATDGEKR